MQYTLVASPYPLGFGRLSSLVFEEGVTRGEETCRLPCFKLPLSTQAKPVHSAAFGNLLRARLAHLSRGEAGLYKDIFPDWAWVPAMFCVLARRLRMRTCACKLSTAVF